MPTPAPGLPSPLPARILHVTEALGGGIEAAVLDYAWSTPQYRHALLHTRRGGFATHDRLGAGFDDVVDAGTGVVQLARHYGPTLRRLRPDVVHLHSAWAGFIGRALRVPGHGPAMVYSPHSFYFERTDIGPLRRSTAIAVERALARRGDRTAALTDFEAAEAVRLGASTSVIPNTAEVPAGLRWTGRTGNAVVTAGRIAAQKDPDFFLAVKRTVDQRLPGLRWVWLGGGEARSEQRLRDAGVEVTGWLPRDETLRRIAAANTYLHTAAWEGSPIVLLETAALGVPTVARAIPPLVALGHDRSLTTPEAVGQRVVETVVVPMIGIREAARRQDQTVALTELYDSVLALVPARSRIRAPRATVQSVPR